MLAPFSVLWRGVTTRGPAEQACSSTGCSARIPEARIRRSSCRQQTSALRAYEPAALLQLAPKTRQRISAGGAENASAASVDPDSGASGRSGGQLLSRDDAGRQVAAGPGVLKINIDLMLWRSRTSRIRARLTLDAAERKALYKAAEDGLRRCLALDPSDPRAYVVLGKALLQQKRFEEARALYQDGCANTGNTNPYIWSAWGWLEALTGNADRARKLYDAAVVVDGTHACAWHKWGMLEKNQGNYTRARDLWMQGIQRCRRKPQSQNAYLYNALGCMAAQLGRVGEARAWFEEGTRTAEGAASVALWQAWAVLEAKQGDPTAVRYLFRKALGANPRSRYVHLAWALWEKKQGNPQQCLALLQRGSQLNPTDPALYQAWALVEKHAGRVQRARELFDQGLKADPNYLHLWQAYGVMEAEQGNLDRARQLFQEGVWADPRSSSTVYVFHAWGSLEWRAGNIQTARELFKAAVRVDPKNETTWASWIAMESELGFVERADELRIRRAEQLWEFVVPSGFTTRPAPGLLDTLSRFFSLRGFAGQGQQQQQDRTTGSSAPSVLSGSGVGGGVDAVAAPGPLSALLAGDALRVEAGEPLRVDEVERILETGDLSSLPDFVSPDDDLEASLRAPGQPWRRSAGPTAGLAASGGLGADVDAVTGASEMATAAGPGTTARESPVLASELQGASPADSPSANASLAPRPVAIRRRGREFPVSTGAA
ncbi:Protein high chlorophyll fluorescent 107 [Pleodorina starrii]|uniref:Protein high chlorophyll fluorescent 107 n=1 Tax=Pleodorina starrii TaxID=330485 RepID=A0A9W6BV08_9CHLO|nr:Protein high chlorophyll fluorescent 107 [Pleodorina starrii]GLC58719.1 Protein high chlorophyll fluorescent 107 [Pleodorina starrii]GLC75196.1 Protein high chlorophyll fluorescent 107 [Pleodorina starrii]